MSVVANEEIKALVSVSDQEIIRLKRDKLKQIILDVVTPLIEEYKDLDKEEELTFPIVAWGRRQKYELKGSKFCLQDRKLAIMAKRFQFSEESISFLERVDQGIEDGDVSYSLDIPRELLVELYGNDCQEDSACLVVNWFYGAGDDFDEEEIYLSEVECGDWE